VNIYNRPLDLGSLSLKFYCFTLIKEPMKNLFAALLIFVISTGVYASIVSIDFETSEGYPTSILKSNTLSSHGWVASTGSTYVVPYSDSFSHTGSRSARVLVSPAVVQTCTYNANWTPTSSNPTVIYSSYMAAKVATIGTSGSYGGIYLTGLTSDSSKVVVGKITLNVDGTATLSNDTGYSATTSYSFSTSNWYQLAVQANFAKKTVDFLLNGTAIGSTTFGSNVTSLGSIGLICGTTAGAGGYNFRYDTVTLNAIPEPATIAILALGMFFARSRK
jgi:hypothetical protein